MTSKPIPALHPPPSRDDLINKATSLQTVDVVVVGGGGTGVGTALEAVRRGLSVVLVEKADFASSTSSKSTNMLHGGVRYLQSALTHKFSSYGKKQKELVRRGLQQEATVYNHCPFLVHAVPLCVPIYNKKDKKIYGKLLEEYDKLAVDNPFPERKWATQKEVLFQFPNVKPEGLLGGWIYYDGQFNDARLALLLALTAVEEGGCILNYTQVTSLVKNAEGRVSGVACRDLIGGKEFKLNAKVVINATGPYSDALRQMDNPSAPAMIVPSSGTHIVLPDHFSPNKMGFVNLRTTDGRVLFALPWLGATLVGTTDHVVDKIDDFPHPPDQDIDFLLTELNQLLHTNLNATRRDILAVWTGIRPLARDTQSLTNTGSSTQSKASSSASVVREHVVEVSTNGLITIAGGKWTTFHTMATDVIDRAIQVAGLQHAHAVTQNLGLVGSDRGETCCSRKFEVVVIDLRHRFGLDRPTAQHLSSCYGTRALQLAELATKASPQNHLGGVDFVKLHPKHPFLLFEVDFAVDFEFARTIPDVLCRRLRLAQVDVKAASEVVDVVAGIMARKLGWDDSKQQQEKDFAITTFKTAYGLNVVLGSN